MRAIEMRIPGKYWDSFLYDDRLYLFTLSGDIHVYRWDQLVQSVPIEADCRPLFWQFLARGRAWYMPELQTLLKSPLINQEIKALRDKLTAKPHNVSASLLKKTLIAVLPSPAHPHTDVEAFYNILYLSSSSGVHSLPLSSMLEGSFNLSTDISAFRIACSYGSMALAAGSEGVFEQTLSSERYWPEIYEPMQLSNRYCASCSWASFDVVATAGPRNAGYIAAFSKPSRGADQLSDDDDDDAHRLIGVIDAAELFPSPEGLFFGTADLLVLATPTTLVFDGWNPYRRRQDHGTDVEKTILTRNQMEIKPFASDPIDGTVTVFGTTIELDNSLVVIGIDGSTKRLREPINWRCFPRSQRYLNHLHVTYGDHVRIYAFTDDYFTPYEKRGPAVRRPRLPFTRTDNIS
jgi:hypothetical protein